MQDDLPKTAANHVALSPVSFLPRAAHIWAKRIAIIHGARRVTYAAFFERSRRLASALRDAGIAPGYVVAALLPNIPEMLEAHNGVPMAHAVLCPINTRLDAATVR
ncbi:MAG: AMP-binding protein, partial [Roseomonas sp.]|nr:AMP-binding protein [Roseomonas sp.]